MEASLGLTRISLHPRIGVHRHRLPEGAGVAEALRNQPGVE
jgi:hypothetical protein